MEWSVDPDEPRSASTQLVERCLAALAAGELAPGDKLPSVRGLASLALVNHNTVARAYRELERLEVVRPEGGRGVFVTREGPRVARGHWQRETEDRFHEATRAALGAGHNLDELLRIAREIGAAGTGRESA